MKVYRFQLKPNKKQQELLERTLELCRFTYNKLLEKLNNQEKIDRNKIQHYIIELKNQYPELKTVHSKILQYECYRLFSNLKGLSKKKGKYKIGRLRFKGKHWFKTFVMNQSGYEINSTGKHYDKLKISKIGEIDIRKHREIEGNIKGIVFKRKIKHWEAHIITDAKYEISSGENLIGIDLGVLSFITTSNNEKYDNPLFMGKSLKKIQCLHRKISKTKKGSNNRKKLCQRLQRQWEKIDDQKKDFFHKISTYLVNTSKLISVENLNIKNMASNNNTKYRNHRNILDSSWGIFLQMLKLKAESAAIKLVEIDPRNTTKMCSSCGQIQDMPEHKRMYICGCGNVKDRDHNAAINILGKGLTIVGEDWLQSSMNQEATS